MAVIVLRFAAPTSGPGMTRACPARCRATPRYHCDHTRRCRCPTSSSRPETCDTWPSRPRLGPSGQFWAGGRDSAARRSTCPALGPNEAWFQVPGTRPPPRWWGLGSGPSSLWPGGPRGTARDRQSIWIARRPGSTSRGRRSGKSGARRLVPPRCERRGTVSSELYDDERGREQDAEPWEDGKKLGHVYQVGQRGRPCWRFRRDGTRARLICVRRPMEPGEKIKNKKIK